MLNYKYYQYHMRFQSWFYKPRATLTCFSQNKQATTETLSWIGYRCWQNVCIIDMCLVLYCTKFIRYYLYHHAHICINFNLGHKLEWVEINQNYLLTMIFLIPHIQVHQRLIKNSFFFCFFIFFFFSYAIK